MLHTLLAGGGLIAAALGIAAPAHAADCAGLAGKALGSSAAIESTTAMPADAARLLPILP